MSRVDQTKLEVAIKYIERIADGCNPVNNSPLEEHDVLNTPTVIRCMYFIKDILEEVRRNDGIVAGKREKEAAMPFPKEILNEFTYVEDKSITHVLNQIYEPIAGLNVKKIAAVKVTAVLKEKGYLLEEVNQENGKTRKVPSESGKELGMYLMEREFNGRTYQSVMYNKNAQEYIVKLLKELVE